MTWVAGSPPTAAAVTGTAAAAPASSSADRITVRIEQRKAAFTSGPPSGTFPPLVIKVR